MTADTIVVNALSVHRGGGSSYLTRQLRAIREVAPDRSLIVLTAPWNHEWLRAALEGARTQRVPLSGVADRIAYEQLVLPRRTDRNGVLYCPGNIVPLRGSQLPAV